MAGVTALRDAAREAIFSAGGRGFVRFLLQGDALLVSDAPRRCADEAQIVRALEKAGFSCRIADGLAQMTPGDELLLALCGAQPDAIAIDWESPLFGAQALCARLLRETPLELDEGARRLIVETARLLWQPGDRALVGMDALRARIAVRLREGKRSGLHEAGRLLCGWLEENRDQGGYGDEA